VGSVELTGIVSTSGGFTAMISGPDRKTYFVRVGERFYDATLVDVAPSYLTFEVDASSSLVGRSSKNVSMPLHPTDK
jgi:hypothetical protein